MSNVVRMTFMEPPLPVIEEEASRLGEATFNLLKPMQELGKHLQALDRELSRVQITVDALDSQLLSQAVHPIRVQLFQAASQLTKEIERVGGLGWKRN
jgi:hypothetical protein